MSNGRLPGIIPDACPMVSSCSSPHCFANPSVLNEQVWTASHIVLLATPEPTGLICAKYKSTIFELAEDRELAVRKKKPRPWLAACSVIILYAKLLPNGENGACLRSLFVRLLHLPGLLCSFEQKGSYALALGVTPIFRAVLRHDRGGTLARCGYTA